MKGYKYHEIGLIVRENKTHHDKAVYDKLLSIFNSSCTLDKPIKLISRGSGLDQYVHYLLSFGWVAAIAEESTKSDKVKILCNIKNAMLSLEQYLSGHGTEFWPSDIKPIEKKEGYDYEDFISEEDYLRTRADALYEAY
jgi:hypothetical protein